MPPAPYPPIHLSYPRSCSRIVAVNAMYACIALPTSESARDTRIPATSQCITHAQLQEARICIRAIFARASSPGTANRGAPVLVLVPVLLLTCMHLPAASPISRFASPCIQRGIPVSGALGTEPLCASASVHHEALAISRRHTTGSGPPWNPLVRADQCWEPFALWWLALALQQ